MLGDILKQSTREKLKKSLINSIGAVLDGKIEYAASEWFRMGVFSEQDYLEIKDALERKATVEGEVQTNG